MCCIFSVLCSCCTCCASCAVSSLMQMKCPKILAIIGISAHSALFVLFFSFATDQHPTNFDNFKLYCDYNPDSEDENHAISLFIASLQFLRYDLTPYNVTVASSMGKKNSTAYNAKCQEINDVLDSIFDAYIILHFFLALGYVALLVTAFVEKLWPVLMSWFTVKLIYFIFMLVVFINTISNTDIMISSKAYRTTTFDQVGNEHADNMTQDISNGIDQVVDTAFYTLAQVIKGVFQALLVIDLIIQLIPFYCVYNLSKSLSKWRKARKENNEKKEQKEKDEEANQKDSEEQPTDNINTTGSSEDLKVIRESSNGEMRNKELKTSSNEALQGASGMTVKRNNSSGNNLVKREESTIHLKNT